MRPSLAVIVPMIAAALMVVPSSEALAQPLGSARWREGDRVLFTDLNFVIGLARSPDRLFAATLGGLFVYDEAFRRFEAPITVVDGYPEEPVTAIAYDPRNGGLWLATVGRRLVQFDASRMRYRDWFPVDLIIRDIVPAERSGEDLFVRGDRGWFRLDTFSRRLSPASVEQVRAAREADPVLRARDELLRDPGFQSTASFIGRAGNQPVQITDVMPARSLNSYWIGTDGGFVYRYDHMMRDWQPVLFGGLGIGAAAVAAGPDGLWFAPLEPARGRYGVARVSLDLQSWSVWAADSSRAVPGPVVTSLVQEKSRMWAGGTEGVFRFDTESGQWMQVASDGLPSRVVLSLAAAVDEAGGVWVGTDRGLARLSQSGAVLAAATTLARPTLSLLATPERLWVGTSDGLIEVDLTADGGTSPAGDTGPFLRPTAALAAGDGLVYAGLGDEVWVRDEDGAWSRVDAIGPLEAPVTAIAVREGVVWAGSAESLVRYDPNEGEVDRYTFAAGDLPDPALRGLFGIVPTGDREAWLALSAGAFRIRIR